MEYIKWDNSLSVNISQFDDQHKKLLYLINEFYTNVDNSSSEKLAKILTGLLEYTIEHFTTEEKHMIEYCYPDYEMHKKQHDLFIMKINEFHEKFYSGSFFLPLRIKLFLKRWIVKHILVNDKKYADFLHQKFNKKH